MTRLARRLISNYITKFPNQSINRVHPAKMLGADAKNVAEYKEKVILSQDRNATELAFAIAPLVIRANIPIFTVIPEDSKFVRFFMIYNLIGKKISISCPRIF